MPLPFSLFLPRGTRPPPARFVRRVYPPGGRNVHRRQGDLRSPRALRRAVAILRVRRRLPRPETELEAARITTAYTPNRRYLRASLGALSRYPALSPQLPDMPRTVDALPLGTAKVAVLKDIRAVRQGAVQRWAMSDTGGWDLLIRPPWQMSVKFSAPRPRECAKNLAERPLPGSKP
jgi:hypothetical protein